MLWSVFAAMPVPGISMFAAAMLEGRPLKYVSYVRALKDIPLLAKKIHIMGEHR